MRLSVTNYCGISRAAIDIVPGVNLLAGDIGRGKSSLLHALACALSGQAAPPSWRRGQHKDLLRDGVKAGSVALEAPDGTVAINYPAGKITTTGRPPSASLLSVGLVNLADLDHKERARELSALLRSDPTEADIAAALQGSGLLPSEAAAGAKQAWDLITANGGGPAACDLAREALAGEARTLKGSWQAVTGGNWGADIAPSWLPEGWTDDLADETEAHLNEAVAEARTRRDATIGSAAVDAARLRTLEEQAGYAARHEAKLAKLDKALDAANKTYVSAKQALDKLPALPGTETTTPCPHCAKPVVWRIDYQVMPKPTTVVLSVPRAQEMTAEARQQMAFALDDAHSALGQAAQVKTGIENEISAEKANLTVARTAQAELVKAQQHAVQAAPPDACAAADAAMVAATTRHRAWIKRRDADAYQAKIARTLAIADVLKPDGVRTTKLLRVLDSFNDEWLQPLTVAAGWGSVRVTPEIEVTYAGRRVGRSDGDCWTTSVSERWRARTVLATAIAQHTDGIVLLDEAGILVGGDNKEALVAMLQAAEVTAVVCMAYADPANVPDLDGAGVGRSWWVGDGTAVPLCEAFAPKKEAA